MLYVYTVDTYASYICHVFVHLFYQCRYIILYIMCTYPNVYASTWRAAVAQKHDPGGSCFVSLGTIPQRAWKILGHSGVGRLHSSKKYSRRR